MAGFLLYGNFTGAITAMMVLVVDDTELARGDTMYFLFRMYDKTTLARRLQSRWMVFWRMTDLESNLLR